MGIIGVPEKSGLKLWLFQKNFHKKFIWDPEVSFS